MLKITRYYFRYLKTRVSTYVTMVLFIASIVGLAFAFNHQDSNAFSALEASQKLEHPGVAIADSRLWAGSMFNEMWMISGSLICILFSGIYISTKSANIFSDGETNGTELIILSKPFTRRQVAAGKFFTMFLISVITSILISMMTFISFMSPLVSTTNGMHLFINTLVGTFLIQLLFSSICILLSMVMGPRATIALGITVTFVPYVASVIVGPLSGKVVKASGEAATVGYYRSSTQTVDNTVSIKDSKPKDSYATFKWFDIFGHWQEWYSVVGEHGTPGVMKVDEKPYMLYEPKNSAFGAGEASKIYVDARNAVKYWLSKFKTVDAALTASVTASTPATAGTGGAATVLGKDASVKVKEIADTYLAHLKAIGAKRLFSTYNQANEDTFSSTIDSEFLGELEHHFGKEFANYDKAKWQHYMDELDAYQYGYLDASSVFTSNWRHTPVFQKKSQGSIQGQGGKLVYFHSEEIGIWSSLIWLLITLGFVALAWRLYSRKDYK